MLCLVDVFFNRQSVFIWVLTVLIVPPILSFIHVRKTSFINFSWKTNRSYISNVISLNNSKIGDYADRISLVTTDTAMCVPCIDLYFVINWNKVPDKKESLQQIRLFYFPPFWAFHLYVATFEQHCIYTTYISSVDTMTQSLLYLSWFLRMRDAAYRGATRPLVHSG